MKIIFHFGAHKTASTHLQHNLNLNRKVLEENGIKYFRFHDTGELRKHAILLRGNIHNKDFDLEKVTTLIQRAINQKIEGYDCAIISYEGILGHLNHLHYKYIYPDAKEIIDVYGNILKGHEIIPLFASRNYDGFLRSSYRHELKISPISFTLNDYVKNISLSKNRWTEIIHLLQDKFEGPVQFYPHEEYKTKWKAIIYQLIKLTGKDIDFNEIKFDPQKKNVSGNEVTIDFYYTLNTFFQKLPKFKAKFRIQQGIKYILVPLFKGKSNSQFPFIHQKEKINPLNDFDAYSAEVEKLKMRYGILK